MKTKQRLFLMVLCVLVGTIAASAQQRMGEKQRFIKQSYQLGLGGTNVLDTYLTPEHFTGPGLTLLSTTERQLAQSCWSTMVRHQLHISSSKDQAGNKSMLEGTYNLAIGRHHAWSLLGGSLTLQAGALASVGLGFLYNTRNNANNPAQARLSLAIMPSGIATYRLPWLKERFTASYEIDLPLAGMMFSPNYGQSYYEIFARGNYDHNVVVTTFVSAPTFHQQFRVGYDVTRGTTLTVGYLGDYQQAHVNNLKQHVWNNSFTIGMVRRFCIETMKRPKNQAPRP